MWIILILLTTTLFQELSSILFFFFFFDPNMMAVMIMIIEPVSQDLKNSTHCLQYSLLWLYDYRIYLDKNFSAIVILCSTYQEIYSGWSWDSRADIDIKRSSRTPLRLSRVPVQGPSTWVNLRYLEYLRKGLNQRSSKDSGSTCAKG